MTDTNTQRHRCLVTCGRKPDETCRGNAGLLIVLHFISVSLLMEHSFKVWDGISDARVAFSASELLSSQPISELSRLTENLNLQRALLHRIACLPSIEIMDKVKVQSIVQDNQDGSDWPLVHLSDGRVIRTRLLVGAILNIRMTSILNFLILILGWCRRSQFTCSFLRGDKIVWMGL